MILDVKFQIYSVLFGFGKSSWPLVTCFMVALLFFVGPIKDGFERLKALMVVFMTAGLAFVGARVFHLIFETHSRPFGWIDLISRKGGMSFNGSLIAGGLGLFLLFRLFFKSNQKILWDRVALIVPLSYGLLRISCFGLGCCWGKVSGLPWAVTYLESSVMPWLGVPVHPVQLYDSFAGFLIFFILLIFRRSSKFEDGQLISYFFVLYGIARFSTEYFRGDSFRGADVALGLSMGQWVSVLLIGGVATRLWLLPQVRLALTGARKIWVSFIQVLGAFFLAGCLPQKPSPRSYLQLEKKEFFEVYTSLEAHKNKKKNILFIATDRNIQLSLKSFIAKVYDTKEPPLIEDIAFWEYFPKLRRVYNKILRVYPDQVRKMTLLSALETLESFGEPYDLVLLTHGLPNHLSTGTYNFFSYRELAELKGKLTNLEGVLLQACFGRSLASDFIAAGAKWVMSYPGLSKNFFFFSVFFSFYDGSESPGKAVFEAKENFAISLMKAPYYFVAQILKALTAYDSDVLLAESRDSLGFYQDDLFKRNRNFTVKEVRDFLEESEFPMLDFSADINPGPFR